MEGKIFHYHKLLCRCLKKSKVHATVKLIRSLKKTPGDETIVAQLAEVKGIILKDVARHELIQAVTLADPSLGEVVEQTLVGGERIESAIVKSLVLSQRAFKEELSDNVKNLVSIKNTGAVDSTTRKPLKQKNGAAGKEVKGGAARTAGKPTAKTSNHSIPNTKAPKPVTKSQNLVVDLSAYTFEDAEDYEQAPVSSAALEDVAELAGSQRKNRRGQRARQQIWEKKYGQGAKHLHKPVKEKVVVPVVEEVLHPSWAAKKSQKTAGIVGYEGKKITFGAPERVKSAVADASLHPSWVAKKQQKKAGIVGYEGKKITFD